jgi:hypothetical protein
LEQDDVVYINNLNKTYGVNDAGKTFTDANGNLLKGDFAMSGKLVITQYKKSNAHLHFRFSSGYRFVLWDQSNDGVFGAGRIGGGSVSDKADGVTLFDATEGLVLEWTVILKDGKAYWYINGKLEQTFDSLTLEYFNIGGECLNAVLYDVEMLIRAEDEVAFNKFTAPYSSDVVNIKKLGQNGDISASSKTFTDASGNALADNYVIRGTINITEISKSNAHLQFLIGSGCRFLLWDSNSDGVFGAGYMFGDRANDTTEGVKLYDANNGLVLEWAVVVNEGKAYWYLGGQLVQSFDSPNLGTFNIGALQMNALVYGIELYVKTENAEAYNTVISEYLK